MHFLLWAIMFWNKSVLLQKLTILNYELINWGFIISLNKSPLSDLSKSKQCTLWYVVKKSYILNIFDSVQKNVKSD